MGLSEKCLKHAVNFDGQNAFSNFFGRSMRFRNFISPHMLTAFRSKHKFPEKMLKGIDQCQKESSLIGYNGLHDFIGSERSLKDETMDFDPTLVCKRFPSISFGCFPTVELYEGPASYSKAKEELELPVIEDSIPGHTDPDWVNPECVYRDLHALYAEISTMNPTVLENELDEASLSSQPPEKSAQSSSVPILDKPSSTSGLGDRPVLVATGSSVEILDKCIDCIPGVTKRQLNLLENCGFHTLRKLLHHFPRTYADLQNAEVEIDDGQYLIFVGKVISSRGIRASRTFSFLEVVIACDVGEADDPHSEERVDEPAKKSKGTKYMHLKKFFRGTRFTYLGFLKSIQEKYTVGDIVCVSGKVRAMSNKDHFEMREYSVDVVKGENDSCVNIEGRPYPIYPSKKGVSPVILRDIISRALKTLPVTLDPLPENITREFGLLSLSDAYNGIHKPMNLNNADSARRRLIFDEFFYLQLGRLFQMLEGLGTKVEKEGLLSKYLKPEITEVFMEWSPLTKEFIKILPYTLTTSQLHAVSEIIRDLKRPIPMNRLLQGDVGCGKTVVAFLACMEVIGLGYQAAFMVPTELLAIQHHDHLLGLLEKIEDSSSTKPRVALLTGSTQTRQAQYIRKGLQTGDISLVIGTHSLIADKVEFSALRIAIVDEQHRFGVVQRGQFNSKLYFNSIASQLVLSNSENTSKNVDMAPHVLAMSATPIPRSLALALYGDMSLTQISDLPPGRTPVKTYVLEGNDAGFEMAYQMMFEELGEGGKVYLVYPVIDQSEQLPQLRAASSEFETISNKFNRYKCGLLHGRMKSDEKEEALRQFRSGETSILLSTQVIEIGVDVPDATMMVVMNAERFGIAQLHQLRGRVGRGEKKSKCIFIASTTSSLKRLKVLEKSCDGFYLANMDLSLRGPGDLLGKKQSGHLPEFPVARLEVDGNILQDAHLAALRVLEMSHDLEKFPQLKAELSMRQPLCPLGD